ncbi:HAD family hydrolase [Ketogulonicigenium vulgare]|uniref:HAD family hydrolase n=1 Tax=Ketogulonicigenium vulgare TaxID=92945 RepID=UPI002359F243|nr:HAD family hydrolase [Ketogulonicigenium vulgare]
MNARAVIFDLDDTLLTAYRTPGKTWFAIIAENAEALGEHDSAWVTAGVLDKVVSFLAREEGRKLWRLEGDATRRKVVRSAFHHLNLARPGGSEPLHGVDADRIADRFESYLEETISLKPGAHHVLGLLQQRGLRLALLTNGSGARQRGKIQRFDLARYFDAIQIEEEVGIGKPEPAAYRLLLAQLDLSADQTWMIGDDPIWDIAAPARLGLQTIYYTEDRRARKPEAARHMVHQLDEIPMLIN